jgi:hypothetical protein
MTQARVLAARLADLLHSEQGAMAEFLVALADFDKRRGWLELGHSSLFYFLHRELGLSKGAAHYRKTAAVKREVWTRDGGRCQWPLESGGVCGSTLRVEYDHRVPLALGGASTTDNVRLLCRVHNDLAARRAFGDEWMNQFTRGATQDAPGQPSADSS